MWKAVVLGLAVAVAGCGSKGGDAGKPGQAQVAKETSVATTKQAATKAAAVAKEPRTPKSAVTAAPHVPHRHEEFMKRKEAGPIGLLFIGDSITDAFPSRGAAVWKRFEPYHPADFGVSGDRTEHVLWRIEHGELDGLKPKATVIMIGTNNIGHFEDERPEWAARGVKKIVDEAHRRMPGTKVLLLGVFPRDEKGTPRRQKVEAINRIIKGYADGKKTVYLDVGEKFLDASGELPADVMPDKLHPNEKGYQIWYDAMWPTLEGMLK